MAKRVVKGLSNLSIDEVSLVDRGANQHALISIAKRAPQADDYFQDVEKYERAHEGVTAGLGAISPAIAGFHNRQSRTGWRHGGLKTTGGGVGGAILGGRSGEAVGSHVAGPVGGIAGGVVGGLAGGAAGSGLTVHHHYNLVKRQGETVPEHASDYFDPIEKKKSGSFGRGGNTATLDTFTGNDPSGVTDGDEDDRDIGPGKTIDGVETEEGETDPPQKSKKKSAGDVNPSKLSGLGKSADWWTNVVKSVIGTELEGDGGVDKHFPGTGAVNPQQSPFPGATGMGQPPTMQSVGAQPTAMGQPTPPPMGAMGAQQQQPGGMPQQLPPDVVQYIQQLEAALDQALGNGDDSDNQDNQQNSNNNSGNSSSSSSGSDKQNPFGKSGDFEMTDTSTFLTELAKSLDDDDQREMVSKALEEVTKANARATQAEQIAKSERDLRLEREFVTKASEWSHLPARAEELGPVLKRMAETLSREDFNFIAKCLSAGEGQASLFAEIGKRGGGANSDVLSDVEARAQELISKSENMTPEMAQLEVLNVDPRAYDEYLRDHPSRKIFR